MDARSKHTAWWMSAYFISLLLLIIVFMYSMDALFAEPWDGTFTCQPGTTYTTAECP